MHLGYYSVRNMRNRHEERQTAPHGSRVRSRSQGTRSSPRVGLGETVDDLRESAVRAGPQVTVYLPGAMRGDCLLPAVLRPVRPGEPPGPGAGHDSIQRCRQRLIDGDAGRGRHNQVAGVISTVHRTELTEDGAGAGKKMLIDRDLLPVQHDRAGLLPRRGIGLPPGLAAAQDQQVGHHAGAGGLLVGPARQPDRPHEIGEGRHLPARGRVAGIHRVAGGEHGDQAAGPDQPQRLDDEVVVDRMAGQVMPPVVQRGLAERHVADRQVIRPVRVTGIGERLREDLRLRMQRRGDRGGNRIQLDTGDPGLEQQRNGQWR